MTDPVPLTLTLSLTNRHGTREDVVAAMEDALPRLGCTRAENVRLSTWPPTFLHRFLLHRWTIRADVS